MEICVVKIGNPVLDDGASDENFGMNKVLIALDVDGVVEENVVDCVELEVVVGVVVEVVVEVEVVVGECRDEDVDIWGRLDCAVVVGFDVVMVVVK